MMESVTFASAGFAAGRKRSRGRVDVAPFQSAGARFGSDIPIECFQSAVRLIEPDGSIYGGAEAVCRTLSYGSRTGERAGALVLPASSGLCGGGSIRVPNWLPGIGNSPPSLRRCSGEGERKPFAGLPTTMPDAGFFGCSVRFT